jgi:hypothetical protein
MRAPPPPHEPRRTQEGGIFIIVATYNVVKANTILSEKWFNGVLPGLKYTYSFQGIPVV